MDATLKQAVISRGQIKASLTRFKNYLESFDRSSPVTELQKRLEKISPLYEKFDTLQSQIESLVEEPSTIQEHAERDSFENLFFQLTAAAEDVISQSRSQQVLANPEISTRLMTPAFSNASTENRIKLPTIELPTFDGSYSNWVKFRDTFESLIHNNMNLSNIEKFHYLNASVKGSAARTIEALGISEINYTLAWNRIKDRYEDLSTLKYHHVRSMHEVPSCTRESLSGLRNLIDNTNNNLLALKALGEPTDSWDTLIIYLLTSKLDSHTQREWERKMNQIQGNVTLQDMMNFLKNHCKYLERINSDKIVPNKFISETKQNKFRVVTTHVTNTEPVCSLCKGNHYLHSCSSFLRLTPTERRAKIQELHVCFNCLAAGHRSIDCTRSVCRKCHKKHNTLLHIDYTSNTSPHTHTAPSTSKQNTSNVNAHTITDTQETLTAQTVITLENKVTMLATATVHIKDHDGIKHDCRVLLDSGSQSHFISEKLANKLQLNRDKINVRVSGISKLAKNIEYQAHTHIVSRFNGFTKSISCLVLPTITENIPNRPVDLSLLEIPSNKFLADPQFNVPREVDMIIGGDLFWDLMCVGRHSLGPRHPSLQKTQLGWIVVGNLDLAPSFAETRTICHLVTNEQIHDQLARFWEIEGSIAENTKSPHHCEQHFDSTVTRDSNGRYIVAIPFKENINKLGNSIHHAEKRLFNLERTLARQPEIKEEYIKFLEEYESLGHMSEITNLEQSHTQTGYYLPHHAVFRASSTTTKLRVVFDGSAKTSSGLSLNDVQWVGPVVQEDLMSILLRFRKHQYVLSADIAKMYRQILVRNEDRKFQRILWRKDKNESIKMYELNTVTYGTASAPFLATKVLQHIGQIHQESHPLAGRAILRDFYVDDLLTGSDSITEIVQLKNDLTNILLSSGFELRKWASNEPKIFASQIDNKNQLQLVSDNSSKTLGLFWNFEQDILTFSVKNPINSRITKRTILSDISQIFDPLGLIGPATIQAKIILQELWQLHSAWDESLPQHLHSRWSTFREELMYINDIRIPRRALPAKIQKFELHGFSDASEKAYGTCIYLRALDKNGIWTTRLLCAKSRVAPLKVISLPRLELCGAQLLAQLAKKVRTSIGIICDEYYWCDSTIVLAWINSPSKQWKTFVANRTAEIQTLSHGKWLHVASSENPADIISRGISPTLLINNNLWWNGPSWLQENLPTQIYNNDNQLPAENISEEIRTTYTFTSIINTEIFNRFSCYTRLIRTIAYCLRFINNIHIKILERKGTITSHKKESHPRLTLEELIKSETTIIKIVQINFFSDEIKHLKANQSIANSSSLISLNPFLDKDGILRVGGRLVNAKIPYNQKHPIILPPKHHVTKLILTREHLRLLHAGCNTTLYSIRKRYWPLSGKRLLKSIIKQCIRCFKVKPVSPYYLMGNVPATRVTPARPFSVCGIDYAGPFLIKEKTRSKVTLKAYLCLFVCFSTKAVHLELATDMTTESFLNCLRRFIARRGLCHTIYSDNGTNFVGARNELLDLNKLLKDKKFHDRVETFLSNNNIQWHLIPPRAPHFGGLWEGAIKSTKYHLKRIIGETRLTYEEIYTVLTQIEACLNSRPLRPLSDDPTDLSPLTPGHFLIGDSLTAFPEPDLRHVKENRLSRYQHLQSMLQHFWQRWQAEYLHQLQQRNKWRAKSPTNFGPGTMVLIKDDNVPPLKWRMGRILELHPGADNITRVVSIKAAEGVIKRPLTKICILPMEQPLDALPEKQSTNHSI
ncbi:uncharacterized protein LOC143265522 [Megachile rotundata]|uniref:uncharacterized protein LOC143265522 n=1 Tax=Megachile rotundata TaxID=143995 RepID=UPI003FCFCE30